MLKYRLTAAAALVAVAAVAVQADIESERLLGHIKFLSSDDMKGRGNGTEELERAAQYVARNFKEAGLQPGGVDGTWFQPFELIAGLTVAGNNHLTVDQGGKQATFTLGTSYYPLAAPANETPAVASAELDNVPLVFAGYGLSAPMANYDDYAKVDVKGKAVLIFSHEPQERDPNSRLNGTRPMPQTTLNAKAAAARNKGARALLVVSDPSHDTDEAPYGLFNADPDADNHGIPVLRIRRDEMKPLLDAWNLDALARLIDKDLEP